MTEDKNIKSEHSFFKKLKLMNRYYKITNFYSFLKKTAIRAGIVLAIIVLILIILQYFFLDFNVLLNNFVETYSAQVIFPFFLVSETVLGLIPPEIFIAWAAKSDFPYLFLFTLATMSYLGGIIDYWIGKRLRLVPRIKNHLENKIADHISKLKKSGGFFIFIGAMLPLPHSMVSLACGLINYNFKHYLIWALFRYLRFFLYALVIFKVF